MEMLEMVAYGVVGFLAGYGLGALIDTVRGR